ncbi:MAG TPA: HAD family hydrolase [Anaerolineaceae bacterium]
MQPRKFLIFDRDGTLIVEKNYLSSPDQVELIPGVGMALNQFRDMGLGLIVITNQSGIGRGFFTVETLAEINQRMLEKLSEENAFIDAIYYCPHLPEEGCSCRKPKTGLILRAANDLKFQPSECIVIGDKKCDIEMGKNIQAKTILVKTGYGAAYSNEDNVLPDYVVEDLVEAIPIIRHLLQVDKSKKP